MTPAGIGLQVRQRPRSSHSLRAQALTDSSQTQLPQTRIRGPVCVVVLVTVVPSYSWERKASASLRLFLLPGPFPPFQLQVARERVLGARD